MHHKAQPTTPTWPQIRAAFQQIWGYPDFRPPQDAIVRSLVTGQDTLVILPTGAGKSICFQLPALLQQGLTLVVSPLVALMENQVQELRQRHQPAAALHSDRPAPERRRVLQNLHRLRLLYLSPETLLTPKVWERLCQPDILLNGLIIDEAHCLVQWGDFRPAYRRLGTVRPALQAAKPNARFPVAAFTATADPATRKIIRQVLGLRSPQVVCLSPYRPNLHLNVTSAWTPQARRSRLQRFLADHTGQAGLVYVRTRRDSEAIRTWLQSRYRVAAYHAGVSSQQRRQIEADWLENRLQFVVCTAAFGMGVNKPDCRWIVHFQAPLLLSEYLQEVGRAGRDGERAEALTLVSDRWGWSDPQDQQRRQFFLRQSAQQQREALALASQLPVRGDLREVAASKLGATALALLHGMGRLRWQDPFHYIILEPGQPQAQMNPTTAAEQMQQYLYGRGCRWWAILKKFGFAEPPGAGCGHCDRCLR